MSKEEKKINPHTNWNKTEAKSIISVGVSCPVFQKLGIAMRDITGRINMAEGVEEKVMYAQELQKETEVLLSCSDYKKGNLDCKNCHFITNLRKKTADLIVKAKKLT